VDENTLYDRKLQEQTNTVIQFDFDGQVSAKKAL
jgi:hypothetical protein